MHQHEDMSDHRLEQRGLLHVQVQMQQHSVHVIVVHLGLIPASRTRQVMQLLAFITREIPADAPLVVAGDFNDWGSRVGKMMQDAGLSEWFQPRAWTYPSRLPLVQLDHVYARGLRPTGVMVPHGRIWRQMSDHLPLVAEFHFV
jgi:endonuclease/exonuclease/phosphatase family metal-dependent hydrolase